MDLMDQMVLKVEQVLQVLEVLMVPKVEQDLVVLGVLMVKDQTNLRIQTLIGIHLEVVLLVVVEHMKVLVRMI